MEAAGRPVHADDFVSVFLAFCLEFSTSRKTIRGGKNRRRKGEEGRKKLKDVS